MAAQYCRNKFSNNGMLDECGPTHQCPQCKQINEIQRLKINEQLLIDSAQRTNSQLRNEVDRLTEENLKLRFMIDNGLGWEDLQRDI